MEELGGDDLRTEDGVILRRLEDDGDTAVANPGFSRELLAVCRGMRKQGGNVEFKAEISIISFDVTHTVIIRRRISQILI